MKLLCSVLEVVVRGFEVGVQCFGGWVLDILNSGAVFWRLGLGDLRMEVL